MYQVDACGNTFAVLFDESGRSSAVLQAWRQTGRWNFDSALVLIPTSGASVEMAVHERDGSLSAMCGNGLRALGAILDDLGLPRLVRVGTSVLTIDRNQQGFYQAPMRLPVWRGWIQRRVGPTFGLYEVEGEPHAVAIVENADQVPLRDWGNHIVPSYNCTVVSQISPDLIRARTFERGVNRETASCGTGACAAATAMAHRLGRLSGRFSVSMSHYILTVHLTQDTLILEGPVTIRREKS